VSILIAFGLSVAMWLGIVYLALYFMGDNSTEWIQILVTLAIVVPLVILTGRYLVWRRWDKERRINRLARRRGLAEFHCQNPEQAWIEMNELMHNPGFSVKVPCQ